MQGTQISLSSQKGRSGLQRPEKVPEYVVKLRTSLVSSFSLAPILYPFDHWRLLTLNEGLEDF